MKKKIIAATLAVSMMATGIGAINCSAAEYNFAEETISGNEEENAQRTLNICSPGATCQFNVNLSERSKDGLETDAPRISFKDLWAKATSDDMSKFWTILKRTGLVAKLMGGGLKFVGKKGAEVLRTVGDYKDAVLTIMNVYWIGTMLGHIIAVPIRAMFFKHKPVSADQAIKNLDEGFKRIQGQEEPKRKMRKAIDGIIGKKQMAKASGDKYKRGDVIYLVGPSGVGKTFSAEILARALMGKYKPFVLSPASVDLKAKESVVSQLFGTNYINFGSGNNVKEMSSLVEYLKINPNGVVIINEYDKMHMSALDEIFRTIMDEGEVNIQGQKVDCSGAIFIITSNESTKSASGGNLDLAREDDGTGSRTFIKHDKAFMNRVNLIEFDNLKYDDYKAISRSTFEKIAKNFEKQYGIKVNVDGIIEGAAKRAEKINQGSRPIVDDMSNGFVQILMEKRREISPDNSKDTVLSAAYDADKDEFKLSEVNKNGELINTTTEGIVFQDELDEQIRKENVEKQAQNEDNVNGLGLNEEDIINLRAENLKRFLEVLTEEDDDESLEEVEEQKVATTADSMNENLNTEKAEVEQGFSNVSTSDNEDLINEKVAA